MSQPVPAPQPGPPAAELCLAALPAGSLLQEGWWAGLAAGGLTALPTSVPRGEKGGPGVCSQRWVCRGKDRFSNSPSSSQGRAETSSWSSSDSFLV